MAPAPEPEPQPQPAPTPQPQPQPQPRPPPEPAPPPATDVATDLIPQVVALRLGGVPAGPSGWHVEWTVVARADAPPLVAVVYEVVAARRFGHGPHVVAIADLAGGTPALRGARVVDREEWGAIVGSPIRFRDVGDAGGPVVVYAPIADGRGRLAILRADGTLLFDDRVTGVSDVRLEDRTGDGRAEVVLLRAEGGESVRPLRGSP